MSLMSFRTTTVESLAQAVLSDALCWRVGGIHHRGIARVSFLRDSRPIAAAICRFGFVSRLPEKTGHVLLIPPVVRPARDLD